MRSGELEILRMDAGERREFLAAELADWIDAGIGEDWRAQVFYRRVKILARSIRATFEEVMAELRADSEALLAEQPPHPGKVAPVLRGRQVALVCPMLRFADERREAAR